MVGAERRWPRVRGGISGLCARAKRSLEEDPASGAVFVFHGRMGDRLKILHWVSHWIAIGPRANGASGPDLGLCP